MSRAECPREQEVLDALASNRWPDRLGEDLGLHVDACAFCKDLGLVAQALSADFSAAIEQAKVPTAGLVWWRAEIRSRQESIRVASRPITLAHYIGVAVSAMIAIALSTVFDFGKLPSFSGLIPESLPLAFLFGTIGLVAVVASVAAYLIHLHSDQ